MSSSTAAAPARKGPVPDESEFQRLAREMESKKGLDPIPPDQYLYFLGKKEPPLQRLVALVRSLTIGRGRGRRSAYCVDERGREVKLLHLEKLLEMDHGNFRRVWKEAVARGLVRRDDKSHPERIYLCGTVNESVGYDGGEETVDRVCTDSLRYLSPTQRKVYEGWRKEQQERFYADFDAAVKYKLQVEREAIALARHVGDRELDRVFATHALPKPRLATAPPQSKLLQLTLVTSDNSQANESVQTRSVPTPQRESVHTSKNGSVPAAASLLSLENREARPQSVSQSIAKPEEGPTDRHADADDYGAKTQALKTLLLDEYGRRFPSETPGRKLLADILAALEGAPLDLLQVQIRQRMKSSTSMGFALKLAEDVAERWKEDSHARANAETVRLAQAEHNQVANALEWVDIAEKTIADEKSSADDKAWAQEILQTAAKAKSAAGGAL